MLMLRRAQLGFRTFFAGPRPGLIGLGLLTSRLTGELVMLLAQAAGLFTAAVRPAVPLPGGRPGDQRQHDDGGNHDHNDQPSFHCYSSLLAWLGTTQPSAAYSALGRLG